MATALPLVHEKPFDFWTVDCETDPFGYKRDENHIPQPFIWGCYNGKTKEYETFTTVWAFVSFIREKKTRVYAHNGGKFDYHYLLDYIEADETILAINGRLSKFHIGEAEFLDSANIFQQTKLAQFGGKLDIDYQKMTPENRFTYMEEILVYLKQDCILLWEKLDQYFSLYGKSLTQAGSSMKVWSAMTKEMPPRQTREQFERYQPYYHGGRVECFASGRALGTFHIVDINSAYPNAMLSRHPFSTASKVSDRLPRETDRLGRALITLDAVSDGAFPFREDGKLIFPTDNTVRRYNITGWELLVAMELDAVKIIRVVEVHTFPLIIDFNDYIHHFYTMRKAAKKEKDVVTDIFCKLFMNSLYGKFGSNPGGSADLDDGYHEYLIATKESWPKWCAQGFKQHKNWGERLFLHRPLPEEDQRYYNVATAASITGFVRAQAFRAIRSAGTPLYYDTDGLFARDVSRLPQGQELGQWKLELTCDRYAIAGKKLYAAEASDHNDSKHYGYTSREAKTGPWKIASKGARLSPQEIEHIADGGTIEYVNEVPTYSIAHYVPRFIDRKISRTSFLPTL